MKLTESHGGKRKGAGRKTSPIPVFTKKFRATQEEKEYFELFMTGDARNDFVEVVSALRSFQELKLWESKRKING